MNSFIIESVKKSIKKSIQYRANLISWFLADIALYAGTFLSYYLLTKRIKTFGSYKSYEVLLYISCFFLVNNIYAAVFAEAVSSFGSSVLNGHFDFDLLKPQPIIKYEILKNLNFPAAISTPFLIALNIYCLNLCKIKLTLMYVLSILCAAILMGFIFFIVYSLTLFGLRSEAISNIALQFLTVSEEPDTVFPKIVRNLLTYIIPVFLFSAVPARIALNRSSIFEEVWLYSSPVLYYIILKIVLHEGLKKYQSGAE